MEKNREGYTELQFQPWDPNISIGRSQNELIKTIYIGIIEGLSDTLSNPDSMDSMLRGLKRVQSMLLALSLPNFALSDENIQKKLGLFYAYCQHQVQTGIESQDCSHLHELPEHFEQLVNTIELCPINSPLLVH